jgi:hypothetical protein
MGTPTVTQPLAMVAIDTLALQLLKAGLPAELRSSGDPLEITGGPKRISAGASRPRRRGCDPSRQLGVLFTPHWICPETPDSPPRRYALASSLPSGGATP